MKIELNKEEYTYLCHASFLEDNYRKSLFSSQQDNDKFSLTISEDDAGEIRDLCGEQLQIVGFDRHYELTSEGEILESLLDKIRVMPGKPHSPFPHQQKPYVIQMESGKAIDRIGNRISPDAPEAHIPLEDYFYREAL